MAFLSEAEIESALLEHLGHLGYLIEIEEKIGPDGLFPERESYSEVILRKRLLDAVSTLNPHLPLHALEDAIKKLMQHEFPVLLDENRRIHKLLTEGIDVEYEGADGAVTASKVNIIDFDNPDNNDWLVVSQFVVINGQYNRRPDVVIFLNGLPIAVIELKAPGSDSATMLGAFNQLQTYKSQIPQLFNTNVLLVTSDGITARTGSLSADLERFMPWRTTDGVTVAPKGLPELSTLIEGLFDKRRLLEMLRYFIVFNEMDSGLVKILAGYHQFHAVNHAVESTVNATAEGGDKPWVSFGIPRVQEKVY